MGFRFNSGVNRFKKLVAKQQPALFHQWIEHFIGRIWQKKFYINLSTFKIVNFVQIDWKVWTHCDGVANVENIQSFEMHYIFNENFNFEFCVIREPNRIGQFAAISMPLIWLFVNLHIQSLWAKRLGTLGKEANENVGNYKECLTVFFFFFSCFVQQNVRIVVVLWMCLVVISCLKRHRNGNEANVFRWIASDGETVHVPVECNETEMKRLAMQFNLWHAIRKF